jgi:hypothetical protein
MNLKPVNYFLKIRPCTSPRKHGRIEIPGEFNSISFGKVMAVHDSPYGPAPGLVGQGNVKIGDVILYRAGSEIPYSADGDVTEAMLAENMVLGVDQELSEVKIIDPLDEKRQEVIQQTGGVVGVDGKLIVN